MTANTHTPLKHHFTLRHYETVLFVLLGIVLILPPFIYESPSSTRNLNVQIGYLQLIFLLAFFPYAVKKKIKLPHLSKVTATIIIAWVISLAVSTFFAQNPEAIKRGVVTFINFVFFVGVALLIYDRRSIPRALILFIPLGFIFVSIPTILHILSVNEPSSFIWNSDTALPFYQNIRHMNYHLCAAVVLLMYFIVYPGNNRLWKTAIAVVVLTVFLLLLYWSGGRGAIFAILVSLLILFVLEKNKRKPFKAVAYMGICSLLSVSILIIFNHDYMMGRIPDSATKVIKFFTSKNESVAGSQDALRNVKKPENPDKPRRINKKHKKAAKSRNRNTFRRIDKKSSHSIKLVNRLSSNRLQIWLASLNALQKSPIVGLGPEGYRSIKPNKPFGSQPHNSIIQFLLEWGVLGGTLFTVLLVIGYRQGWKQIKLEKDPQEREKRVIVLSLITGLFCYSLYDGIFYNGISVMAICLAMAVSTKPAALVKADG